MTCPSDLEWVSPDAHGDCPEKGQRTQVGWKGSGSRGRTWLNWRQHPGEPGDAGKSSEV